MIDFPWNHCSALFCCLAGDLQEQALSDIETDEPGILCYEISGPQDRSGAGYYRMNEVELIRRQLGVERQHAADVSRACADALAPGESRDLDRRAPLEAFRQSSVDYLVWILSRFEEREQVFHDLLRSRFPEDHPDRRAVESALALQGTSREALAKLETALSTAGDSNKTASRWTESLQFFNGAWSARRDEIDRLFERQAKITDWRAVSAIDADSIVDERNRYARVKATLPAGIEMQPAASRP